ncbi:MAG: hypothetical protein RSA01_11045, partial [Clostridium sp.]
SYKRGITYIEVILSLFILVSIMTIVYPFVSSTKTSSLDSESKKIVSALKLCKSDAIGSGSLIKVKFEDVNSGGYKRFDVYNEEGFIRTVNLSSGFVLKVRKTDLNGGNLVFKSDGTLGHGATTIFISDIGSSKDAEITLTIGYTRIKRIN